MPLIFPVTFIMLQSRFQKRCTFPMSLEDLIVSSTPTSASSFFGTVVFWVWFCPNHRCCQMQSIRSVLERPKE